MKYQKFVFIGFVFLLFLLVSCTSPITPQDEKESEEDKEAEAKFIYIAKLQIEEEEKLLDSIKFVLQQNIPIEQPDDCDKHTYDTNAAVAKEFNNRTYPEHFEEFRNSIIIFGNHTFRAYYNLLTTCIKSRTYRLSGDLDDLGEIYNYQRLVKEEVGKADEILLHIQEFLSNQAG